jgi:hypothetical protein
MVQAGFSFDRRLREIDMFFQGTDPVHRTMAHVVEKLEQAGIPYAIVGGMAVNAHKYERTTRDVDVLLTREGFEDFLQRFVPGDFEPLPNRPRRLRDRTTEVTFDVLVTGLFPGTGQPGPIAYPDPAAVRETIEQKCVVNLPTLIELKLAARRHRDFGDVVELIRFNDLDETFQEKLHPSVRRDYIECLEEKRRDDEYEARLDQALKEQPRPKEPPPS